MNDEVIKRAIGCKLIYVSGKTCTGKTTLSKQLAKVLNCRVIETDNIVLATKYDEPVNKFVEIYKKNENQELVDQFIKIVTSEIDKNISESGVTIVEGAIANNDVLERLIEGYDDCLLFAYLHPVDKENYVNQISQRFRLANENNNAGLPRSFWNLIDHSSLEHFFKEGAIDEHINDCIGRYASLSMKESSERLEMFKGRFSVYDIEV